MQRFYFLSEVSWSLPEVQCIASATEVSDYSLNLINFLSSRTNQGRPFENIILRCRNYLKQTKTYDVATLAQYGPRPTLNYATVLERRSAMFICLRVCVACACVCVCMCRKIVLGAYTASKTISFIMSDIREKRIWNAKSTNLFCSKLLVYVHSSARLNAK